MPVVSSVHNSWPASRTREKHNTKTVPAPSAVDVDDRGIQLLPPVTNAGHSDPKTSARDELKASYAEVKDLVRHLVPNYVIRFAAYWLWMIPTVATVGLFLARCFRAQARSKLGVLAIKSGAVLAGTLALPRGSLAPSSPS